MLNQNQPLVYFLAKSNFGDDLPDFIKIGHTRQDLSIRQAAVQTGNEARLWDIGVIPFDTVDEAISKERAIHSLFGAFRTNGEWFYATSRIIQYIENHAVQHTELLTEELPEHNDSLETRKAASFGTQLKYCRDRDGMSQEELAARVGCTGGYISFLENNRGTPGRETYTKLVELFGECLESTTETSSNNPISVKMPDGNFISENTGIDTFIEVIKVIGIEKVKKLNLIVIGIPLVADRAYDGKAQRKVETDIGTYYIVSGTAGAHKKRILENIASRLKIDMTVYLR